MSKRLIRFCTVPACGEPARACCDVCDEPRCGEHGASSSFESNGVGDTFQCTHEDADPWSAPPCQLVKKVREAPPAQLPLGLHGRINGTSIARRS